jgi:thiamine biosynthesis lipoprotein
MGTQLTMSVSAKNRETALAASELARAAIERAETRLSTWRVGSELDRLNRTPVGEWVAVSPELELDLEAALDLARITGGAFDPVIGSLVAAWDLRGNGAIPDRLRLGAAIENTGHELVELDDGHVRRLQAGATIEEGGFGKGAGLRDAVTAALAAGAECIRLDLGGQLIMTSGCGPRTIDIADPRDRKAIVGSVVVEGVSVATSGNSVRGLEVGGLRVGHLLDPRIGRPAHDWGTVTVIARDPVQADCLATALFVMGPEDGLIWADGLDDVEAVFAVVDHDRSVILRSTSGIVVQPIVDENRAGPDRHASMNPDGSEHRPYSQSPAGLSIISFE